ncbi:MAG: biotin/lipoyl-binding protein [Myxococcales bacterium]|nr:biotin/lipoyl-binding protein [Myxococcales bacterium]
MRVQAAAKPSAGGEGTVRSPMPGRVVRVLVKEGDEVEAGAPVVVVEAMKMENELVAERAGTVKRVVTSAGATVEGGAVLVEIS